MKITFVGGAQCVTGSCTLLEYGKVRILVDCGLAQGQDAKNGSLKLPFDLSEIDYVLLTHAHVDHCGRLPLLGKVDSSFCGKVLCTKATAELCDIILSDSARIQENEAQRKSKHSTKQVEPLYTSLDADNILKHFCEVPYGQEMELSEGLKISFSDAGHMLGSSSITVKFLDSKGIWKTLLFSGDIGNTDQPIIKDPVTPPAADFVVMESTYGMKNHKEKAKSTFELSKTLEEIIERTFSRGGKVIIPAFAIGRSQEILYLIRDIRERTGKTIATYLDSPMSVRATAVFMRNARDCYDEEAMEILDKGKNPILFPGFKALTTSEESKSLNESTESCIIIASSGMCEAGRIVHHLKHNICDRANTIVFTGYQAEGTLGRRILEGAKSVTIHGERIAVRSEIVKLNGISGHADQSGLLSWIDNYAEKPHKVFVVHGDKASSTGFASILRTTRGLDATAPSKGQSFEI